MYSRHFLKYFLIVSSRTDSSAGIMARANSHSESECVKISPPFPNRFLIHSKHEPSLISCSNSSHSKPIHQGIHQHNSQYFYAVFGLLFNPITVNAQCMLTSDGLRVIIATAKRLTLRMGIQLNRKPSMIICCSSRLQNPRETDRALSSGQAAKTRSTH